MGYTARATDVVAMAVHDPKRLLIWTCDEGQLLPPDSANDDTCGPIPPPAVPRARLFRWQSSQ
jgi:hypothetical protein